MNNNNLWRAQIHKWLIYVFNMCTCAYNNTQSTVCLFYFPTATEITFIGQTADAGDDYVDIGMSTTIDFVDGEVVEEQLVTLEKDALVEGMEYFEAQLGAITVGDTDKITVDAMLDTATIFIMDITCMFYIKILIYRQPNKIMA